MSLRDALDTQHAPSGWSALAEWSPQAVALRGRPLPSNEVRRFSAALRTVQTMLVILAVLAMGQTSGPGTMLALLAMALWAAGVLGWEASRQRHGPVLWQHVGDVVLVLALYAALPAPHPLLVLLLVAPIIMTTIHRGLAVGALLALGAAAGLLAIAWLAQQDRSLWQYGLANDWWPALGVAALGPATALLSQPLNATRRRAFLAARIEHEADPRRGQEAVLHAVAARLAHESRAASVLVVAAARGDSGCAVAHSKAEGSFRTSAAIHHQLSQWLAPFACGVLVRQAPRRFGLFGGTRQVGQATAPLTAEQLKALQSLCGLLACQQLDVLAIAGRLGQPVAHLLLLEARPRAGAFPLSQLPALAPDIARLVEQAALVDELNAEIAAHERARIGRDLHDSAIQPYLGLRYAVEVLAMRTPPANELYDEVQSLLGLVNSEVAELREVISTLRTGEPRDNALVPAVRRQVKRFALLFGIQIHLECSEEIGTSRALAWAVFHMMNECLNNVRKHTDARQAWVRLWADAEAVHLAVRDDAGSVRGAALDDFVPGSLSERVRELGGTLQVGRPNGLDTEITLTIPLPRARQAANDRR